ncbi:MAG: hypothetical protein WD907_03715, partial [Bacilli bacterium]
MKKNQTKKSIMILAPLLTLSILFFPTITEAAKLYNDDAFYPGGGFGTTAVNNLTTWKDPDVYSLGYG